jgi:outer membrane immunogenic protein
MAVKMPVKAPPPPPAPVYSWTGWYVGGNIGYSWGNAKTDVAGNGTVTTLCCTTLFFPSNFGFADQNTARLNGVIGGGQIGYNYQFSPKWVIGFEADIQGAHERGSGAFNNSFSFLVCDGGLGAGSCGVTIAHNGTAATAYQAKIDWFGTVRGRLGFLVGDQLLIYGTGGLAYGRVQVAGNAIVNMPVFSPTVIGNTGFSASKTNTGFTVGGGVEGRLSPWLPANWTWKLEYLYLDLGSLAAGTSQAASPTILGSSFSYQVTDTITTHTHFTDNILRVGLNYQFH